MTNKKLTIAYSPYSIAQQFIMDGLLRDDIEKFPLKIKNSKINKLFYYFFLHLHLYNISIRFRYSSDILRKLRQSRNVLLFDCSNMDGYIALSVILKNKGKTIFFWNPLESLQKSKDYFSKKLNRLKSKGYRLSTFDPQDATDYNIDLIKNVDRNVCLHDEEKIDCDFYFVGKPKGREEIISNLKNRLEAKGYKLRFILINSYKDAISPMQNIRNSANAKCIVDIVSPMYHQVGLTLRPFDAMFLGRKIITNAVNIDKYDFYNPNNIYIIRDNDLTGIEEFMDKPYTNVPKDIEDSYEINNWIEQFI